MPQTTPQLLRSLTVASKTARVVEGELRIRGPQPLAGPLPDSIKAMRGEIVNFLEGCGGGVWPSARDSEFYEIKAGAT